MDFLDAGYVNLVYGGIVTLLAGLLAVSNISNKRPMEKIIIVVGLVIIALVAPIALSGAIDLHKRVGTTQDVYNAVEKAKQAAKGAEAEAQKAELEVAIAKKEVGKAEQAKDRAYAASSMAYGNFLMRIAENKLELFDYNEEQGFDISKYHEAEYYAGDYVDDQRTGYGIVRYNNERIISGQWKSNFVDGFAVETNPRGEFYAGQWEGGRKKGYGVYSNTDGQIFSGQINHTDDGPKLNGYGRLNDRSDKDSPVVYWGQFTNSKYPTGYRMDEFACKVYLGHYSDGKFHGIFKVTHRDDSEDEEYLKIPGNPSSDRTDVDLVYYAGEWDGWNYSGHGIIRFANGDYYAGEVKNSKPTGYGILFDKTDKVISDGGWKNGEYTGK